MLQVQVKDYCTQLYLQNTIAAVHVVSWLVIQASRYTGPVFGPGPFRTSVFCAVSTQPELDDFRCIRRGQTSRTSLH